MKQKGTDKTGALEEPVKKVAAVGEYVRHKVVAAGYNSQMLLRRWEVRAQEENNFQNSSLLCEIQAKICVSLF